VVAGVIRITRPAFFAGCRAAASSTSATEADKQSRDQKQRSQAKHAHGRECISRRLALSKIQSLRLFRNATRSAFCAASGVGVRPKRFRSSEGSDDACTVAVTADGDRLQAASATTAIARAYRGEQAV